MKPKFRFDQHIDVLISQVESELSPHVTQVVPKGSSVKAVLHQWMHAIATGGEIFGSTDQFNLSSVKEILSAAGLYKSKSQFHDSLFSTVNLPPAGSPDFTFIDLFAGIGGTRLGFQNNGGACVFTSEYDSKAQETYYTNYGEYPFGDITKIDENRIPRHDVLVAGFPCQAFSHAGLKKGIEDTRGTLFYDIARILRAKKPRFALLENVKGLISHDKGHTLKTILDTLTGLGYKCNIPRALIEHGTPREIQSEAKKMVLRSVDFGVRQNRQRIYIVLWRDDLGLDSFTYPSMSVPLPPWETVLEENPAEQLTISDRLWAGHRRRKAANKAAGKGFGYGLVTKESEYTNTISARYYKDGSEILIEQEGMNPRKVSIREAARLQGFPESFIPSSSSVQAYKQFGNSVSVPVIEAVAAEIKKELCTYE